MGKAIRGLAAVAADLGDELRRDTQAEAYLLPTGGTAGDHWCVLAPSFTDGNTLLARMHLTVWVSRPDLHQEAVESALFAAVGHAAALPHESRVATLDARLKDLPRALARERRWSRLHALASVACLLACTQGFQHDSALLAGIAAMVFLIKALGHGGKARRLEREGHELTSALAHAEAEAPRAAQAAIKTVDSRLQSIRLIVHPQLARLAGILAEIETGVRPSHEWPAPPCKPPDLRACLQDPAYLERLPEWAVKFAEGVAGA